MEKNNNNSVVVAIVAIVAIVALFISSGAISNYKSESYEKDLSGQAVLRQSLSRFRVPTNCNTDLDCPYTSSCIEGYCAETINCMRDLDCPNEATCIEGDCYEQAKTNIDDEIQCPPCPSGQKCKSGKCYKKIWKIIVDFFID